MMNAEMKRENEALCERVQADPPVRGAVIPLCKNPRCVTVSEPSIPRAFRLADPAKGLYRCEYCDEPMQAEDSR